jgi:hypothetical protein
MGAMRSLLGAVACARRGPSHPDSHFFLSLLGASSTYRTTSSQRSWRLSRASGVRLTVASAPASIAFLPGLHAPHRSGSRRQRPPLQDARDDIGVNKDQSPTRAVHPAPQQTCSAWSSRAGSLVNSTLPTPPTPPPPTAAESSPAPLSPLGLGPAITCAPIVQTRSHNHNDYLANAGYRPRLPSPLIALHSRSSAMVPPLVGTG